VGADDGVREGEGGTSVWCYVDGVVWDPGKMRWHVQQGYVATRHWLGANPGHSELPRLPAEGRAADPKRTANDLLRLMRVWPAGQ
jgi:hypothetical protein